MTSSVIVLEKDLTPLYESECEKFGSVCFCVNHKKDWIYKYIQNNGKVYRVQCECCQYQRNRVNIRTAPVFPFPEGQVDEDSEDHLGYQLYNSYICDHTGELVIRAKDETTRTVCVTLNLSTERFSEHDIDCRCNQRVRMENSFEHGAQGVQYRRQHRDESSRPLVCVALTEHTNAHHSMEYFCSRDGRIGKYFFCEERKCFVLIENLDLRVVPFQGAIYEELHFDDTLDIKYGQHCSELKTQIFFGTNGLSNKVHTFAFDRVHHQFERVECECCEYDSGKNMKISEQKVILALYASAYNHQPILLIKKGNNIEKHEKLDGRFVPLEKAPIRRYAFSSQEYERRKNNGATVTGMNGGRFPDSEKYVIRHMSMAKHIQVATLDGQVRVYEMTNEPRADKDNKYVLVESLPQESQKKDKAPTLLEFAWQKVDELELFRLKKVLKKMKFDADEYDVGMISENVENLYKSLEVSQDNDQVSIADSTETALEPSDDEDLSDTESTATAVDFSPSERAIHFYQIINSLKLTEKDDDQESTATAIEPTDDDEMSDTETALEPSDDEVSDTETALEPSDSELSDVSFLEEGTDVEEKEDEEEAVVENRDEAPACSIS